MEFFNSLNLKQIKGGTKLKQGDLGSVLSYSLTDENGQEITSFDEIVVSTEYLKKAIEKKFDVHNVTVIKNVVPRFLWSYPRKPELKEDLVKPTVLYSGSPCHYTNPIPR